MNETQLNTFSAVIYSYGTAIDRRLADALPVVLYTTQHNSINDEIVHIHHLLDASYVRISHIVHRVCFVLLFSSRARLWLI